MPGVPTVRENCHGGWVVLFYMFYVIASSTWVPDEKSHVAGGGGMVAC
jgi:hypothetical protein